MVIDAGMANAPKVRVDYRRGFLFVKRAKVGEWSGEDGGRMKFFKHQFASVVPIQFQVEKVNAAVRQLVQE